jgi:hypothetical protein
MATIVRHGKEKQLTLNIDFLRGSAMRTIEEENQATERRKKPRICDPVPVLVRGQDENGASYSFDSIVKDVSAGGVRTTAPRKMNVGERISVRITFSLTEDRTAIAPVVFADAVVARNQKDKTGAYEFTACFISLKHSF